MTDLTGSRQLWDDHARRDPLWAILSEPDKKGGRWDPKRFFQTGVGEISYILYQLQSRGVTLGRRSALDFGCGVGRLTQALATHFEEVVGLDISPRMIELAIGLNRFPARVRYAANERADLRDWEDGTFDFVVSNIVLQHIRPELTLEYLREFHRVLVAGGIMVFQLPSHERGLGDQPPPPQTKASADDAYQAVLAVAGTPDSAVRPGAVIMLEVEVTNASDIPWSQQEFGVVRVGNHWLDGVRHRMLLRDDGRTSLPTLASGERCRLVLSITAPSEAGDYQCEIDLCHEGVVWFGEKGSPVVRFPVRVGQSADAELRTSPAPTTVVPAAIGAPGHEMPALGDHSAREPEPFPMYGIPKDTVVDFIAGLGGELIHAENDPSCGDDWVSFRYYVRTRA